MIPRTKKLFISYRSSDAPKVDRIAHDLGLLQYDDQTPRYTTWQDKHNLPPASPNWWDAIVDAIIDCDVFVFNMSSASLQSEVCLAELDYAHKRNRPIVPIVLEDEFYLDPKSGKYNITYWDLVPDWLRDVQFLFYVGADFYHQFQTAVEVFERKWPRDINVPRPMNPDSKSVHGSNHALYDAACDYAERLAFADAEKHFSALVRRNDADYADVAAEWLELLALYAELIEINERRSARFIFKSRWAAYQSMFPKHFLDDVFDPRGFGQRSANKPSVAVSDPPPVVTERPPQPAQDSPRPEGEGPGVRATADAVRAIIGGPFEWCEVPGGRGTMKTDKASVTLQIPTERYWIAKYPITNTQYAAFIKAGGYRERQWWSDAGWQQREKDGWTEPRRWTNSKYNGAEQPVVSVSWYEVIAYCRWLSEALIPGPAPSGRRETYITLPTEAQWQYAAQGVDGRTYPWGNDFDKNKCNTSDSGIGKTTPVTQYPQGASPYGVLDMSGNVWEWCLNDYHNPDVVDGYNNTNSKVLRGGSFSRNQYAAAASCRNLNPPSSGGYDYGLRLVVAAPISAL